MNLRPVLAVKRFSFSANDQSKTKFVPRLNPFSPTSSAAKWHFATPPLISLRNTSEERLQKIVMTYHYPDLDSAFDWSCWEGKLRQPIGHLHDSVSLLLRPEFFSFCLSYLILVIPARFKQQKHWFARESRSLKDSGGNSKMTPSCKRPIRSTNWIWVVARRHQYGLSAVVPPRTFFLETSSGVVKWRLFSQVAPSIRKVCYQRP